jgi:hypothetical protein
MSKKLERLHEGLQDSIDDRLKVNLPPFLIDIAVKCFRIGKLRQ